MVNELPQDMGSALEERLGAAAAAPLADNVAAWLRLTASEDEWQELQILERPAAWGSPRNWFAHARGREQLCALLSEAECDQPVGVYVVANEIADAIVSRAQAGIWHMAKKGASTSDRDIARRRVLFVDVDACRPSATSATDAEMASTIPVAAAVYAWLADRLGGPACLAYGHSGNGRQVFVALEPVQESADVAALVRGILGGLAARFSSTDAKIDAAVGDAKRLVPAFGTTKRKGAPGREDRPHRRTGLVVPPVVRRVSLEALVALRAELGGEQPAHRSAPAKQAPSKRTSARPSVFEVAKAIPVRDVIVWLGLDEEGEAVRCPGCRNTSGVSVFENGLKCHHASCASKGAPGAPGFRTTIDLVVETLGLDARAAADALVHEFPAGVPEESCRPRILIDYEEEQVADRAIAALADDHRLFARGGTLVHVLADDARLSGVIRAAGAPRIATLPHPRLRELLAVAAVWLAKDNKGEIRRSRVPAWVVNSVQARGRWPGLRVLDAVVETPVLRPDGSVISEPGYDAATGLLYLPNGAFESIPHKPSSADACHAMKALLEVIADFPMKSEAHRSAWVAALLTPFARFAFRGPAPLMLIDANTRGAGKSLASDVIGEIVCGRAMARMTQAEDDAEERKRITTVAIAGYPTVLIDNVVKPFGTGALDAALTAEFWSDRLLGTNVEVRVPLITTWYATGNNVTIGADTTRRCLHIRLESPDEKPEERTAFLHPDLRAWVRAERARLVVAAVTVLRAFFVAGAPDQALRGWGSFEGWSSVVRNAIAWVGLPDPGDTREEFAEHADREAGVLADLIAGWKEVDPQRLGLTVQQVLGELDRRPSCYGRLRAALAELVPTPPGKLPSARSVGMHMAHLRGRVCAGECLRPVNKKSPAAWRVFDVRATGEAA